MSRITWQVYLATTSDPDAIDPSDALARRSSRNVDRVRATHVDPVAYHAIGACASLDDEIDSWER